MDRQIEFFAAQQSTLVRGGSGNAATPTSPKPTVITRAMTHQALLALARQALPLTGQRMRCATHRDSEAKARSQIARHLERAAHLAQHERDFVLAVVEQGTSIVAIARLMDIHESTARRRLVSLARRISAPLFAHVLQSRLKLSPKRRAVAEAMVLRARPLREIGRELGLTLHQVRCERAQILASFVADLQRQVAQAGRAGKASQVQPAARLAEVTQ